MMTKRTCENCRWWSAGPTGFGYCHIRPPIISSDEPFASTHKSNWCGEWSHKTITPEQQDRKELTRRFAVALAAASWTDPHRVWELAEKLAAAESQIQREVHQQSIGNEEEKQ